MTDVAWFTLAQPTAAAGDGAAADDAADDVAAADEAAVPPAAAEDVAEAQPASAEHSSTASTVPRTWRGDIMLLGRTPRAISSMVSEASQSTPAAMMTPVAMSSAQAISSLRSPVAVPIRAPSSSPARDMATLTTPNTTAARARLVW